jgi:hypothetical protein
LLPRCPNMAFPSSSRHVTHHQLFPSIKRESPPTVGVTYAGSPPLRFGHSLPYSFNMAMPHHSQSAAQWDHHPVSHAQFTLPSLSSEEYEDGDELTELLAPGPSTSSSSTTTDRVIRRRSSKGATALHFGAPLVSNHVCCRINQLVTNVVNRSANASVRQLRNHARRVPCLARVSFPQWLLYCLLLRM